MAKPTPRTTPPSLARGDLEGFPHDEAKNDSKEDDAEAKRHHFEGVDTEVLRHQCQKNQGREEEIKDHARQDPPGMIGIEAVGLYNTPEDSDEDQYPQFSEYQEHVEPIA